MSQIAANGSTVARAFSQREKEGKFSLVWFCLLWALSSTWFLTWHNETESWEQEKNTQEKKKGIKQDRLNKSPTPLGDINSACHLQASTNLLGQLRRQGMYLLTWDGDWGSLAPLKGRVPSDFWGCTYFEGWIASEMAASSGRGNSKSQENAQESGSGLTID